MYAIDKGNMEMAKLLEASGTKLTPEDIDAIRVVRPLRSKLLF